MTYGYINTRLTQEKGAGSIEVAGQKVPLGIPGACVRCVCRVWVCAVCRVCRVCAVCAVCVCVCVCVGGWVWAGVRVCRVCRVCRVRVCVQEKGAGSIEVAGQKVPLGIPGALCALCVPCVGVPCVCACACHPQRRAPAHFHRRARKR